MPLRYPLHSHFILEPEGKKTTDALQLWEKNDPTWALLTLILHSVKHWQKEIMWLLYSSEDQHEIRFDIWSARSHKERSTIVRYNSRKKVAFPLKGPLISQRCRPIFHAAAVNQIQPFTAFHLTPCNATPCHTLGLTTSSWESVSVGGARGSFKRKCCFFLQLYPAMDTCHLKRVLSRLL